MPLKPIQSRGNSGYWICWLASDNEQQLEEVTQVIDTALIIYEGGLRLVY